MHYKEYFFHSSQHFQESLIFFHLFIFLSNFYSSIFTEMSLIFLWQRNKTWENFTFEALPEDSMKNLRKISYPFPIFAKNGNFREELAAAHLHFPNDRIIIILLRSCAKNEFLSEKFAILKIFTIFSNFNNFIANV